MRRYRPLVAAAGAPYRPVHEADQRYCTLTLPAAGALTWTAPNHIIAYYRLPIERFSIVSAPATTLPLYVRDNGARYTVVAGAPAPDVYAPAYAGQMLSGQAVFEFWSAGAPDSVDLPSYELTISLRAQECCCGDGSAPDYPAILYTPYCAPYPVCFPICAQ